LNDLRSAVPALADGEISPLFLLHNFGGTAFANHQHFFSLRSRLRGYVMKSFMESMIDYETWLKSELGREVVRKDLDSKHEKMKSGVFPFLRATYWRWAESILEICPELSKLPQVMAIGDTHLENYGMWRDVEGRLVWGANDFDDAARMPYILDLVRLGVSASLARRDESMSVKNICEAVMDGYKSARIMPEPIVLEKEYGDLRKMLVMKDKERRGFWRKLEQADKEKRGTQWAYEIVLQNALPDEVFSLARRSAGTGSLGRPRFVGMAVWKGGYVVREAKRLVQSAWCLAHRPDDHAIYAEVIAKGRHRSPDPHFVVSDSILVRRLSLNSRKIDAEGDLDVILSKRMLYLMGQEIGNCHAGDASFEDAADDFDGRDVDWLRASVKKAVPFVREDQREFARQF
jgi:hypothetical protein